MRVLFLSSEVAPWCRTGGLGDVAGALAATLGRLDPTLEIAVVVPLYRAVRRTVEQRRTALEATGIEADLESFDTAGSFLAAPAAGPVRTYFLDAPDLYDRDGLYGHPDDARRFGALAWSALQAAPRLLGGEPDVLHAHDWQTALAPVYAATRLRSRLPDLRSVFTVHNLAYHGSFDKKALPGLGLPWSLFVPEALEFWDRVCFLKGGIVFADTVTTVSPSYAKEIATPAHGHGLDGLLRAHTKKLHGILNGIDTQLWDPETDAFLPAHYSFDDLDGKPRCRAALLAELGLEAAHDHPLCAAIARLTTQKGLDQVAELVPRLRELGARLVVLANGDIDLERRFEALAAAHPTELAVRIRFDEALSHRITAGADLLLMPSRWEPCGLSQMYAMAYGTLPVVHATGGLIDTVVDAGTGPRPRAGATGWHFSPVSAEALFSTLQRAVGVFRHDRAGWRRMQRAAMTLDFGWDAAARTYLGLYAR